MNTQKVLYREKAKRNKNSTILLAFSLIIQFFFLVYQFQDISGTLFIFYMIGIVMNVLVLYKSRKKTITFLGEKENSVIYMDILITLFSSVGIGGLFSKLNLFKKKNK